ncbi:TetR/AcrR family transcriptional regulator [Brevibacillus marinus]|uniref:TetR/AcrR family transcriptional regulator n=1 Tax=Brevibacillus marinus TaxID=2496837 RepID=UPI000F84DC26|nr:TetR/AcrR family transcriptional regulator [Brevibacillus marinus]
MAKPNVVSKQELIEAAKACIVENGLEKLTLKMVADKANVSQGTVYYHFHTKNQLMMDVVKDVCLRSWEELSHAQTVEFAVPEALNAAKERCRSDSFFHRLFLSLVVLSFNNEEIKQELGQLLLFENKVLSEKIQELMADKHADSRVQGPAVQSDQENRLMGVSTGTWAVIINALIDGLAVQSLVSPEFDRDKVFAELGVFFQQLLENKSV